MLVAVSGVVHAWNIMKRVTEETLEIALGKRVSHAHVKRVYQGETVGKRHRR